MTTRLDDFIENLTDIELSQHTFGTKDNLGNIKKMPRLISLINQGIKKMHSTFLIKQGTAYVCVKPCCKRYLICHENSEYIRTEDSPLRLIEVLQVISCDGRSVRLNATHRRNPDMYPMETIEVWMPKYNVLEFNVCKGLFRVDFRRNGEEIPKPQYVNKWHMADYVIDLPDAYIDALTFYICSKLFTPSNPTEGYGAAYSPAILYRAKFQEEVQRLKNMENFELEGLDNYQQRFNESGMP